MSGKQPPRRTFFGIAALLAAPFTAASQTRKAHRVVVEMSVGSHTEWQRVINHVNILRIAFESDVEIEVVCLGEGLAILKKDDTEFQTGLQQAAENGVVFAACQNSMRSRNVKSEDLFPFATEVPYGMAEIVKKQEAGYSYLKVAAE